MWYLLLAGLLWAQQDLATRRLLDKYDVRFWWLNLTASHTSVQLGPSWVLTRLTVTASELDTLVFELHSSLIVDSVIVEGWRSSFIRRGHTIRVPLSPRPVQGTSLEAVIHYRGTPPFSQEALSGIYNRQSPSWGNRVTWTLSQPFGAYTWWPTKQLLHDKADSLWTFITVPMGTRAGAVGILEGVDTLPNGLVRFRWKSRYPIVYYLVAFSVAEYIEYNFYVPIPGIDQPVFVQNYIYNNPQTLPTFKAEIDTTAALLREFARRYGPYPFWREKYGHMMAPFSGGMEHQTMTTQGFFFFTLTAHELAHQWFGDWVTCGSWQDIWLNEGFATYSEYIALEALGTPQQARAWLIEKHNAITSERRGSVWVSDTLSEDRIFDSRLTYDKGAYLLHMIRFRLGNDSLFFLALRTYLDLHGGGNAWLHGFRSVLEMLTGESWQEFFEDWYYGEGYPILTAQWNAIEDRLWLRIRQEGSWSSRTPLFRTPLAVRLRRSERPDTTVRVSLQERTHLFSMEGIGTVQAIEIDPDYWILRQIASVERDATLGMNASPMEAIIVVPNPVHIGERLSLYLPAAGGTVAVYDVTGKLLHTFSTSAKGLEWQIQLPPGTYFLVWEGKSMGRLAVLP